MSRCVGATKLLLRAPVRHAARRTRMRSTTRAMLNRTDRSAVDWCGTPLFREEGPLLSALPRVRVQRRIRVCGLDEG